MDSAYVDIQMSMHRMQELDELLRVLKEQKESNLVAIRRLHAQHESNVYLCGGAFFQRVGKETALKEIEEHNQRIDKNIAENRAEYEIQVKKLHQMGIYGFCSVF